MTVYVTTILYIIQYNIIPQCVIYLVILFYGNKIHLVTIFQDNVIHLVTMVLDTLIHLVAKIQSTTAHPVTIYHLYVINAH